MKRFVLTSWLYIIIALSSNAYTLSVAYFSPEDHPTKKLINLIDSAKTKIHAAVYMLTDKNIAQALIRAKERNVDVQIITDKITVTSSFGKSHLLRENGIPVYFFNPPSPSEKTKDSFFYAAPAIMHHKFALIDTNLWTGSFNWTRAADQKNHEDVLLTDNRETYASFREQFKKLKEKCTLLTKEHMTLRSTTKEAPILD